MTGTGWPRAHMGQPVPRYTALEVEAQVAAARRDEQWRLLLALGELETSWRPLARDAYRQFREALRDDQEARVRASGRPEWIGVGPRWRPWTREKSALYYGLLATWERP